MKPFHFAFRTRPALSSLAPRLNLIMGSSSEEEDVPALLEQWMQEERPIEQHQI